MRGNGCSIESAGQEPDSAIAAGSEIDPENTLKVETRVRTPLGLRGKRIVGVLVSTLVKMQTRAFQATPKREVKAR